MSVTPDEAGAGVAGILDTSEAGPKVVRGSALPTEFSPGNIIPIGWRSEDCRAFAPAT